MNAATKCIGIAQLEGGICYGIRSLCVPSDCWKMWLLRIELLVVDRMRCH